MRVPPSKRDNLTTDGAQLRIWHDTRDKLKQLAALRRQQMAEAIDAIVDAALQAEWDRLESEADETPEPTTEQETDR